MNKIEQIKQWHEYHGSCVDALLKGYITLEEFNLHEDEFDRFFDALYSSPEPQKVVCPECNGTGDIVIAGCLDGREKCPLCGGTGYRKGYDPKETVYSEKLEDLTCPKCHGTGKVSQSVSTPTEGMELSSDDIDHEFIKYPQLKPPGVTLYCCIKDILRLQVAKVLSNLPTEQEIRESERKEIAKEILDEIEKHCTLYQWIEKPDFTKRHYPLCPTDFYELKAKYLQSGQSPKEV